MHQEDLQTKLCPLMQRETNGRLEAATAGRRDIRKSLLRCMTAQRKKQPKGRSRTTEPNYTYQDRLGEDQGKPLIIWRSEEGTECKGTAEMHRQQIAAIFREASRDPKAKVTAEDKEFERRKQ